jgi:RNA polymerase sigma-70 factor (ECF subfamily)
MSFFLRRVRDHAEAEDLTQDVFARLAASEQEIESPDAFVFQVAANLLRDRARIQKVRSDYLKQQAPFDGQDIEPLDPYRIVAGRDLLAVLLAGMDELPERTRDIFTLYRIENLDQSTIAQSYGISRSAVKKHVMRAMAYLMARVRGSE